MYTWMYNKKEFLLEFEWQQIFSGLLDSLNNFSSF